MSQPQRIAFVSESAKMGGVEFSTLYLVQHMDQKRFQPLVICPEEGEFPDACREHGIDVRIVPRGHLPSVTARVGEYHVPNPLAILIDALILSMGALRLRRILRRGGVKLVCTKGLLTHFQGGLAARLAGVPCVWHLQDRVSDRALGLYRRLMAGAARALADHVIADGPAIVEQLPSTLRAENSVSLIYNGVNTREFSPAADGRGVRSEFGLGDDTLVLGNVSRLTPWKGQHLLIDVFGRLAPDFPHVHLLLVGAPVFDDDTYEKRLQRRVSELELSRRVTFAGYRWDLPQVLASMDAFAYTAVEKDTSPLALLSAMAAGKPIVAPALSGVQELFHEGVDGLLVPPDDPDRLYEALKRLLEDGRLRAKLAEGARRKAVQAFSVQHFVRRCQSVFERVLEEGTPRERTQEIAPGRQGQVGGTATRE